MFWMTRVLISEVTGDTMTHAWESEDLPGSFSDELLQCCEVSWES